MSHPRNTRRALSNVISSLLLSAVVLAVGGVLWNYANGASGVIASQYHDESMDLVSQIKERFMVEHVTNNATHLTVFVYNYGEVGVTVDVYANGEITDTDNPLVLDSKTSGNATIAISCTSGENIGIKIYSRRQNSVYYSYIAK
jgi:hypothetical protein